MGKENNIYQQQKHNRFEENKKKYEMLRLINKFSLVIPQLNFSSMRLRYP